MAASSAVSGARVVVVGTELDEPPQLASENVASPHTAKNEIVLRIIVFFTFYEDVFRSSRLIARRITRPQIAIAPKVPNNSHH